MKSLIAILSVFSRMSKAAVLVVVVLAFVNSLVAQNSETSTNTYFLNINTINISKILPPPPANGSKSAYEDENVREDAIADANREQLNQAHAESHNEGKDEAEEVNNAFLSSKKVMGYELFNERQLPTTAALFEKVDHDIDLAITDAKDVFQRPHPPGDNNTTSFSYPSGHSTRAFVWATLLSNFFPNKETELMNEARQKAWDRVILGDHYPSDVNAGEAYGIYLANVLLNDPNFQQEWNMACQEIEKWKNQSIFSDIWNQI